MNRTWRALPLLLLLLLLPSAGWPALTPVLHWKLDDGAGTTAADSSGYGHPGSLVNGPLWTPSGFEGGGLTFDGTNDYVQTPNHPDLAPEQITLALWVRPTSLATSWWNSTLANHGVHEWSDGYYGLALNQAGSSVALLNIGGGAANSHYLTGPPVPPGAWHHLALTYDGAVFKLYRNGVLAGSKAVNRVRTKAATSFLLGRRGDGGYFLNGALDDVRVYPQALSAAEIATLVGASVLPAQADLPLHWKLDDGAGTSAFDSSGNGHSGSLVNGPAWTSSGAVDGALAFDGVNDHASAPYDPALAPEQLTLALWVRPDAFSTTYWNSTLANHGVHEWSDGYYGLALTSAGVPTALLNIGGGGANAHYLGGPAVTIGAWHHLALVYDNVLLKLYVNGNLAATKSVDRVRTKAATSFLLARRGDGGYFLRGALDDVRLYTRALAGSEVADLAGLRTLGAHWRLDDGAGTSAFDSSGNGHAGTLVNGPAWTTAGNLDGALDFDGVNDQVFADHHPDLAPEKFTLSLWVRPTSYSTSYWNSTLANHGLHEWSDGYYGLALNSAGAATGLLNIGGGSANAHYLSGPAVSTGAWHHLALTYDNAALKLYLDGLLVGSKTINRVRTKAATRFHLGRRGDGGYFLHGALDDVRLHGRAFTASEIAGFHAPTAVLKASFDALQGTEPAAGPAEDDSSSCGATGAEALLLLALLALAKLKRA